MLPLNHSSKIYLSHAEVQCKQRREMRVELSSRTDCAKLKKKKIDMKNITHGGKLCDIQYYCIL